VIAKKSKKITEIGKNDIFFGKRLVKFVHEKIRVLDYRLESSLSPAKNAKRFESSSDDSLTRLTTKLSSSTVSTRNSDSLSSFETDRQN
jgi:hypothetical protein